MYRETFLGWFRFACITKNLGVVCSDRAIAQRFGACKRGGESTLMFSEFRKHGSVLSKRATRQLDSELADPQRGPLGEGHPAFGGQRSELQWIAPPMALSG